MKKLIGLVAILAIILTLPVTSKAQMWSGSGNKVSYTYPTGLTGANTYTFPSFQYVTAKSADTVKVTTAALETWLKLDTLSAHTIDKNLLIVTPGAGQQAGCKLFIEAVSIDSARTVYVKQGATVVDTLSVTHASQRATYIYNGTIYKRFY